MFISEDSGVGTLREFKKSFVGFAVDLKTVENSLRILKEALPEEVYAAAVDAKAKRDGAEKYHMTVVSPAELKRFRRLAPVALTTRKMEYQIVGVGSVKNDETQTWFAVVSCPKAQEWRNALGLVPYDFHITLGFTKSDIHGVPKDATTLIQS